MVDFKVEYKVKYKERFLEEDFLLVDYKADYCKVKYKAKCKGVAY